MSITIIIPALNEEENLERLLSALTQERSPDTEIIVADAGSEDKTVEIAKRFECKVVKGGLPAKGRNEGAKIATGNIFLFLDADNAPEKDFVSKALREFEQRNLDVASTLFTSPRLLHRIAFYIFYNYPILLLEHILPHGAAGALVVKRRIFERIGGFDESITLAEDHYFIRQAAKYGKFGVLRSPKIFLSPRRFQTDGWIRTYGKFLLCELYMIFLGPVKSRVFSYRFGHYAKKSKE